MSDRAKIKIRHGTADDIKEIVAIDQKLFSNTGCEPFTEKHVKNWLATHPDGLLVAEVNGRLAAFTYMQLVHFDPTQPFGAKSYDELTDHGHSLATHCPDGNAFCTITMDSCSPLAGLLLFKSAMNLVAERGKPYGIGTSRLSGFNGYLGQLEKNGIIDAKALDKKTEMQIAQWYAAQTAKRTKAEIDATFPEIPNLNLPKPERSDPVLGFYTGHGLSMHSIHADFLPDAQSRNYSVITVLRTKHAKK